MINTLAPLGQPSRSAYVVSFSCACTRNASNSAIQAITSSRFIIVNPPPLIANLSPRILALQSINHRTASAPNSSPEAALLPHPNIICPILIRQHMVRIELYRGQPPCRRILERPAAAAFPNIDRKPDHLRITGSIADPHDDRHRHPIQVIDRDQHTLRRVAIRILDGSNGLIQFVGGKEPFLPEPVQVLAQGAVHRPEEIVRLRVLECPMPDILPKGIVEPIAVDDDVP